MGDMAEENKQLQSRVKQLEKELDESRGNKVANKSEKQMASDQEYIQQLKSKIGSLNDTITESESWKQNTLQEIETLKLELGRGETKLLSEARALQKIRNEHKRVKKCLMVMTTRGFVRNVVNRRMIVNAHKTLSQIIINTIKTSKGKTVVLEDGPALRSKEDLDEALRKTRNISKTLVTNRVSVRDCLGSMNDHIGILEKIVEDCSTQIDHWKNTADSHFSRTIVLSNAETIAKQKLGEATARLETALEDLQISEEKTEAMEAKMAEERACRLENEKKKKILDARKDLSEAKDVAILAERARTLRDKVRGLEDRCQTLEIKRERLLKAQQGPPGPGALTERQVRRKQFVDEMQYLNTWALRSMQPPGASQRQPPLFGRRKRLAHTQAARQADKFEDRSLYNRRVSPRTRKGSGRLVRKDQLVAGPGPTPPQSRSQSQPQSAVGSRPSSQQGGRPPSQQGGRPPSQQSQQSQQARPPSQQAIEGTA